MGEELFFLRQVELYLRLDESQCFGTRSSEKESGCVGHFDPYNATLRMVFTLILGNNNISTLVNWNLKNTICNQNF